MFNKTRNRLVLFNAITLILMLNLLGAIMYFTTEKRLYNQVDATLSEQIRHLDVHSTMELLNDGDHQLNRRLFLVVWDDQKNLIRQSPGEFFDDQDDLKYLKKHTESSTPFNVTIDHHVYRILNSHVMGVTFQFIYDLDPERSVLNNLLFTILWVDVVSIVLSIGIGFFLARRALIPIKKSWDKQQQFVSDASHELRSPLTVLQVQLDRLFRHPFHTIEEESQKISIMMDETRRMSKLVGDLLTLARSDTDQIELLLEKMNLHELLERIIYEFSDLAQIKQIVVEKRIETPIEIVGDKERLHQLFVILIDNAIKYTPERGTITISSRLNGRNAEVCICDNGVGIPEKDLPYIFDRFYRVNKSRSRAEGGTGLGLSIAQWIVQAHHGTIEVKSQEGEGSCFTIHFPLGHKYTGT